jgi:NADH-quinone oxidoreductase subunit C
MPEETKGPEPVSPVPEGAGTPTQKTPAGGPAAPSAKPETIDAASSAKPADTVAAAPVAKPADAKPAAPVAAKPAAPAVAKPAAPAKPAGPQPEPWNSDLVTKLKKQYGSGIREANTYVGQKYLLVDSGIVFEVLSRMLTDEQYDYCVDITAVHWPKREQPFDIIYILYSFQHNERVRIKAQIAETQHLQSAVNLWPTANWLEREVFDMFGIIFDGHPDLNRILLPDGWKGHPLRKDYDILLQDKEWVQINLGIESGQ